MSDRAPFPFEPPAQDGPGPGGPPPSRPRRSRARRLAPLGVAAFAVLEIYLLTVLADLTGGWVVFAVLAAGLVLGVYTVRRAGRRAWRNLNDVLQAAADPQAQPEPDAARDRNGNILAMIGGLLLIVPGLVTDVAALLFLFPPTATLLRRGAERMAGSGELGEAVRDARAQARIHRPDGRVVQGEVVHDDEPRRD
jgi:UPF0716 protein FxsA